MDGVLVVAREALAAAISVGPTELTGEQVTSISSRIGSQMGPRAAASTATPPPLPRRRRRTSPSPLMGLAKVAAVALVGIIALPQLLEVGSNKASELVVRSLNDLSNRSPAAASPEESTAATLSTADPIPRLPVDAVLAAKFSCPGTGHGWSMTWRSPGPLLPSNQTYLFEWRTGETWIRSGRWASPTADESVGPGNVQPGREIPARLSVVVPGVPEISSAHLERLFVAPADSC